MINKNQFSNSIDFMSGEVILFDKPYNMTSFEVIKWIKRIARIKKIGHAGTLDPLASGLLILCTGRFTKKINEYQDMPKVYEGKMYLGATTPSYDLETEVSEVMKTDHISLENVKQVTKSFLGEIWQTPPIFSAVKVDGKRSYKKARKGEAVEIQARKVLIEEFEIIENQLPEITFRVKCSKGTYIRSLVNDFGIALNTGAYMTELKRTAIGEFSVNDAIDFDFFTKLINNAELVIL